MFTHQTILSLRLAPPGAPASAPVFGHFRDYHFARNVMEAKQYLSRCLRHMNPMHFRTPDLILIDAGADNADIKSELERWIDSHPRLGSVRIIFPAKVPWIRRCWNQWLLREPKTAAARPSLVSCSLHPLRQGCG
jgi:hypothetical protein